MEDPDSPGWVGKSVRDIYGRRLGRAIGIVFDVGGNVTSVGVEEGDTLIKINPDQIFSDETELVIHPQWKLECNHVGLERGTLMKRMDALNQMVESKRISSKLADEMKAKLNAIRRSHEVVLTKTLAHMSDLERAVTEMDDFVSMVTLQYVAGEMNDASYSHTLAECERIRAISRAEIVDIKRTLGMATDGEPQEQPPVERVAPSRPIRERPTETETRFPMETRPADRIQSSSPEEEPSVEVRHSLALHVTSDIPPPTVTEAIQHPAETRVQPRGNGDASVTEPEQMAAPEALGLGVHELDDPSMAGGRKPEVVDLASELASEAPAPPEAPDNSGPQRASPPGAEFQSTSRSSPAQMTVSEPRAEIAPAAEPEAPSSEQPLLGAQVSEWIFARITDLEALDIRPGDYKPLKSLETRRTS